MTSRSHRIIMMMLWLKKKFLIIHFTSAYNYTIKNVNKNVDLIQCKLFHHGRFIGNENMKTAKRLVSLLNLVQQVELFEYTS